MGRTALIVDDSPTIRQMVGFTLHEAGFRVLEGGNGVEGLERLAGERVDLIITDLNMPQMDGIAFIRELRARPASKYTPVLMLTTESQAEKKQQGKAAGATGWIVKPFHPGKLLDVVGKVLP
ncbi:MAG TPA: response regulator [Bryobacteraceae bacterium]|jgi:two-component system chemotaxis response regulator CheY